MRGASISGLIVTLSTAAFGVVLGLSALALFMALLPADNDDETEAPQCHADAGEVEGVPSEFQDAVEAAAAESGLSVALLAAQIEQESGWNPDAVSVAGAQGISQFMPGTWDTWGQGGDVFDPDDAIPAQGRLMGHLYDFVEEYASDEEDQIRLTLAAYNAGPGAVQEFGGVPPYSETEAYVRTIMTAAQGQYSADCTSPGSEARDLGSGEWTHPLPGGLLTSGYGSRPCPPGVPVCDEYVTFHHGVDFSTGGGAEILAPTDMEITATSTNAYQGEFVIGRQLDGDNYVWQFHHCETGTTQVAVGQTVPVETTLCTEGSTGNSSGPHLHLQINRPQADDTRPTWDYSLDPEPILREVGVL